MRRLATPPALHTLRDKAADAAVPLHAQLELTHRCNVACRHCYLQDSSLTPQQELTLSEIEDLLDNLAHMQTLFLSLTGGEPLLRPDFADILRAATARGFAVLLLTNGTLLTPTLADEIAAANPFQVHLSLLGLGDVHDRMTGRPGSFDLTVKAMDLLRERSVFVVAKLILTREAFQNFEELKHVAAQHADHLRMTVELLPTLEGRALDSELLVPVEDLCALDAPDPMPDPCASAPGAADTLCAAGRSLLTVSPYGELMPCLSFRQVVGNVRRSRVRDLWHAPQLEQLRALRQSDLSDCQTCELVPYCRFCPGRALLERGSITAAAPSLCKRAHTLRLVWQAWLADATSPRESA